jgi:hypothetical protein
MQGRAKICAQAAEIQVHESLAVVPGQGIPKLGADAELARHS